MSDVAMIAVEREDELITNSERLLLKAPTQILFHSRVCVSAMNFILVIKQLFENSRTEVCDLGVSGTVEKLGLSVFFCFFFLPNNITFFVG